MGYRNKNQDLLGTSHGTSASSLFAGKVMRLKPVDVSETRNSTNVNDRLVFPWWIYHGNFSSPLDAGIFAYDQTDHSHNPDATPDSFVLNFYVPALGCVDWS